MMSTKVKFSVLAGLATFLLLGYANCEKPLSNSQTTSTASTTPSVSSATVPTAATPVPVASPSPLVATSNVTEISASGSFTIAVTGGVSPYTYTVSQGGGTVESAGATATVVGPFSAGTVIVNVTDTADTVVEVSVTATSTACTTPWGASVPNGGTVSAYQASAVNCGSVCLDEVQTCTNGVLSGTFTQQSCEVTPNTCEYRPSGNVSNTCTVVYNVPQGCSTIGTFVCYEYGSSRTGATSTMYECLAPLSSTEDY